MTALSACDGGGSGECKTCTSTTYTSVPTRAWYDVYGHYCGTGNPMAGCNFYFNGDKIEDFEDPYFNYSTLRWATWTYTDSYGYRDTWTGWGWLSPTGILYDDFGYALNAKDDEGRDILEDAAEQEQNVIDAVGENLAARFELDAEVSVHVAEVLHDWATIGKTRARTNADVADFSKRLYGIDVNEVKDALQGAVKGDKAQLEGVISQAANNWSTTPETMKQILRGWYGKELSVIGL